MICPSIATAALVAAPHAGRPVARMSEPHVGGPAARVAPPHVGRPAGWLARLGGAVTEALGSLRTATRAADRAALEREALRGMSLRMLKDVGASPWLVADAAARAHDRTRADVDTLRF